LEAVASNFRRDDWVLGLFWVPPPSDESQIHFPHRIGYVEIKQVKNWWPDSGCKDRDLPFLLQDCIFFFTAIPAERNWKHRSKIWT